MDVFLQSRLGGNKLTPESCERRVSGFYAQCHTTLATGRPQMHTFDPVWLMRAALSLKIGFSTYNTPIDTGKDIPDLQNDPHAFSRMQLVHPPVAYLVKIKAT